MFGLRWFAHTSAFASAGIAFDNLAAWRAIRASKGGDGRRTIRGLVSAWAGKTSALAVHATATVTDGGR